uniref:Uncharacterized protein n=1 Tax=Triatoma infestans TaxID=30076 RepID=A0A170U5N0_TRIIF
MTLNHLSKCYPIKTKKYYHL